MTTLDLHSPTVVLNDRARLLDVVAAASSLPERAAAELFAPVADADSAETIARVDAWLAKAAADPESARTVLRHRARTGRALGAGLRPVVVRDPDRLPAWAQALTTFLDAQPASSAADASTLAAGSVLDAFGRAAEALLPTAPRGEICGVAVAPAAWQQIRARLVERLAELCHLSLGQEVRLADRSVTAADWPSRPGTDASRDGWLTRFERLPGLAYVIGVTCEQWRAALTELFARLATDLDLLRRELWDGGEPGALTSYKGDAGDRHADGRSVALLEFAGGQRVVYKPKDMQHAVAFMQLADFLNSRGLPLGLHTRRIVPREDYGWEEYAVNHACDAPSAFPRYYRRLGMLVRLMQLLEGRDMWADNLLADGEFPVIVDLECLLYPRVQPPPAVAPTQRAMLDVFEETVVRTAMAVQPWVPSKERPVIDIGCLSHAGDPVPSLGHPVLPLPPYRPHAGDVVADPWEYADDVLAGYRDMHDVLVALREDLAGADGPLAGFAGAWVRYIWRHTWDGYKIVRATVSPLALDDGATRETVLAGVLRGAFGSRAGSGARADIAEIAEAEVDAFRRLDIPLFRSLPTSSSVFTVSGREIPAHFQGTAWDRLLQRVAALESFDVDRQAAVLSACIDAARNAEPRPLEAIPARPATAGRGALLDAAVAVADTVLSARCVTGSGAGWLGASWYPVTGLRQVEVLGVDLVSGSAGVAVLLAEVYAATGEPRFWDAARTALDDALAVVGHSPAFAADTRLAGGVPVPGGLAGPGALIHALARCAVRLGDTGLFEAARGLVPGALAVAATGAAYADAGFGTAGLLLNLLRLLRSGAADDATTDGVRSLTHAALAALRDPAARFAQAPEGSPLPELFAVGRDGVAMAVARAVTDASDLLDPLTVAGAREALAAHTFDLSTGGGRLAAADVAATLGSAGRSVPRAPGSRASTLLDPDGRALLADLVTAAAAGRRDAAAQPAGVLLARHDTTGSWFPERVIDDRLNLGALDGLPAVGVALLSLLDPATTPISLLR